MAEPTEQAPEEPGQPAGPTRAEFDRLVARLDEIEATVRLLAESMSATMGGVTDALLGGVADAKNIEALRRALARLQPRRIDSPPPSG